jgi:2'-hydroxyisoflavone reductase
LGNDSMWVDVRKAVAAGLTFRQISEIVGDTIAWNATRPQDYTWRAGMKVEKEEELLGRWGNERTAK